MLGTLGASGATKWYWGQHAKVCDAINRGNLKEAIEHAVALHDLGISELNYESVINDRDTLKLFKDAFVDKKGKMNSYTDETVAKGIELIDAAIASAPELTMITPAEEQAILDATLPLPPPEPSFLRRNAMPLFLGGGALVVGTLGMILLIKI